MNVPVLVIRLHGKPVGKLFGFDQPGSEPIIRFVADPGLADKPFGAGPVLSEAFRAEDPDQQKSLWYDLANPLFNARPGRHGDWQLPSFFQNLLPEGRFRFHVSEDAKIDERDHIRMLAACGKNLPGAVTAEWEDIPRAELQRLITQNNDALEMSVWSEPYQDALSISGVQPKLGVAMDTNGRFVGRTSQGDVHIIAKLPSPDHPRMPQLEDLCMRMAAACSVAVCEFALHPLGHLAAPHRYDLGEEAQGTFLAVHRFDRVRTSGKTKRVHFEDFAQVFGVLPEEKYQGSYQAIALQLMALPGCGEAAVLELLRRIAVNDLLGNADMHLKNLGLLYKDPATASLAPAYDITSTAVYINSQGHALHFLESNTTPNNRTSAKTDILKPTNVMAFCRPLGLNPKLAEEVIRDVTKRACTAWLPMVQASGLSTQQKLKLVRYTQSRRLAKSWLNHKANAGLLIDWQSAEAGYAALNAQQA